MFYIQVSNPDTINNNDFIIDEIDEDIKEIFSIPSGIDIGYIIQTIFPLYTEDALIYWQGVIIPLSYKYDLSVIYLDILYMLDEIFSNQKGAFTNNFASNTFRVDWDLIWDTKENKIQIYANWENLSNYLENILSSKNYLEMELNDFLYEWKGLLKKIIDSIEKFNIENIRKSELDFLYRIESHIPKYGLLYRNNI